MVLDTNVVSELMRSVPEPAVLKWLDAQLPLDLWLTAVVAAELMYGVARLPDGNRKKQLAQNMAAMLEQDLDGQVLAFDLAAASIYADIVTRRERTGQPIAMADAQSAAICLTHGADLITRNQKDFEDLGLVVINPWLTS